MPGKDFFYYYGNNSAAPRAEGVGATLSTWHQTSPSVPTDAIAFGPPTITKITLPPGGSWPGVGQSYHLSEDAYYVVVAGEARLPGLDNGTTFKSGDWMWGMAGVTHGPVTAAPGSAANLTILAVGTALDARVGGAPVNFSNPTVDQDRSHARRRACQYRDGGLGCFQASLERRPLESFLQTTAGGVAVEGLVRTRSLAKADEVKAFLTGYTLPTDAAGWLRAFVMLTSHMQSQICLSDITIPGNPLIFVNRAWCDATGYS